MLYPELQRLSFSGNKLEDVTEFLRDVQTVAFTVGRQRDDDWRADYVATCLSGPALIFYMSLNSDDRYSWDTLCRLLLLEFSRRSPEAPAAAPAPTRAPQLRPADPSRYELSPHRFLNA